MILKIKWNTGLCFICIFLFAILSTNAQSNCADSLFKKRHYRAASIEFERQMFLNKDPLFDNSTVLFSKAECYRLLGEYQNSVTTLNRINVFMANDSIRYNVFINKALSYFYAEKYDLAISSLVQAKMIPDRKNDRTILCLLMLSYNYQNKWKLANSTLNVLKNGLKDSAKVDDDSDISIVQRLYDSIPKLKSNRKVFLYSFVPGMGIVYAGNTVEGLLNFTLSALPIAYGGYQAFNGFYITGYLTGTIALEKFYFGGRARAEFLVNKYNFNLSKNYNEKLKNNIVNLLE